ncbi:MAG TPA: MarR family EPS-associated transcriptional regulator [Syntrophales bacterium]|nr:MarR family EPS-associated transcriptional regulator [Syntrophales bacterium]
MTLSNKQQLETEEVLKVLREIAITPEMTQRELSSRLGISLGKVNFLINVLIQKGLVKAQNFKNSHNKKAYLYYLTPRGFEEKAKITYRFLRRKIQEFEQLESEIRLLKKEAGVSDTTVETPDNTLF